MDILLPLPSALIRRFNKHLVNQVVEDSRREFFQPHIPLARLNEAVNITGSLFLPFEVNSPLLQFDLEFSLLRFVISGEFQKPCLGEFRIHMILMHPFEQHGQFRDPSLALGDLFAFEGDPFLCLITTLDYAVERDGNIAEPRSHFVGRASNSEITNWVYR